MKKIFLMSLLFFGQLCFGKPLSLPKGKGNCPKFSFEVDSHLSLKSDRAKGDRWLLMNQKAKSVLARFDYKLSNTDQKQLPQVADLEIQLGKYKWQKFTVTASPPEEGRAATTALTTSYSFIGKELDGLVVMSDEYDLESEADKKIEKILSSIKLER